MIDVRIDYKGDNVDDVAISAGKSMFRIEQMDDEAYWVAFYPDGSAETINRYTFWISIKEGKLACDVVELPEAT